MKNNPTLIKTSAAAGLIAALLAIAWGALQWIKSNRAALPAPRSEEGRALSLAFNMASNGVFLLIMSGLLL